MACWDCFCWQFSLEEMFQCTEENTKWGHMVYTWVAVEWRWNGVSARNVVYFLFVYVEYHRPSIFVRYAECLQCLPLRGILKCEHLWNRWLQASKGICSLMFLHRICVPHITVPCTYFIIIKICNKAVRDSKRYHVRPHCSGEQAFNSCNVTWQLKLMLKFFLSRMSFKIFLAHKQLNSAVVCH